MLSSLIIASILVSDPQAGAGKSVTPDPTYSPAVDDRAVVGFAVEGDKKIYQAPVVNDETSYFAYYKTIAAKDQAAVKQLAADRKLFSLPAGTPVRVLQLKHYDEKAAYPDSALIAVLEGTRKDRRFWIDQACLLAKVDDEPRKSDPAAAGLMRSARNLEKSGKTKGAIDYYSKVVAQYSGSIEAEAAKKKIMALGGTVPEPSSPVSARTAKVSGDPARSQPSGNFTRPKKRRYASQEASRRMLDQMIGNMGQQAISNDGNRPTGAYGR